MEDIIDVEVLQMLKKRYEIFDLEYLTYYKRKTQFWKMINILVGNLQGLFNCSSGELPRRIANKIRIAMIIYNIRMKRNLKRKIVDHYRKYAI